jgi:putative sterol carrier protein
MILEPIPPFNPGDKVLCVKDAQEVNLDNSPKNIIALDDDENEVEVNVGAICTNGQIYDVDCCLWSPYTGWVVVITGEFHKADCFKIINRT